MSLLLAEKTVCLLGQKIQVIVFVLVTVSPTAVYMVLIYLFIFLKIDTNYVLTL